jgi:hypothetical protein
MVDWEWDGIWLRLCGFFLITLCPFASVILFCDILKYNLIGSVNL